VVPLLDTDGGADEGLHTLDLDLGDVRDQVEVDGCSGGHDGPFEGVVRGHSGAGDRVDEGHPVLVDDHGVHLEEGHVI
jgi:hypothetical protein